MLERVVLALDLLSLARERAGRNGNGIDVGDAVAGRRVARRERVRDLLVVRPVLQGDAEAAERVDEHLLRARERDAVLRAARPGERRLDVAEVELDDLRVLGMRVRLVPEEVLLAVRLDERDARGVAAGQAEVAERHVVDGEEAARRAVLRGHVPERRAVGEGEGAEARPEVLDELPDDAGLAQDLRDGEDEVGRGRALAQRAGEPEADDLRHEHRERLAEHRRLGLDPADAPAEHAEAVDHRRVRVGADDRVGEGDAVAHLDDAREVLEVDLVDDAGVRRHDLEVVERALSPAEERVALLVPLELELDVALDREPRRELVDLDGVVDDELDGDERVDLLRVAALLAHRVAHRGEVDDARHAGEVLQQDAAGEEGDLLRRLGGRDPVADRVGVAAVAEHVLEEDAKRVGEPRGTGRKLVDLERLVADCKLAHTSIQAEERFG